LFGEDPRPKAFSCTITYAEVVETVRFTGVIHRLREKTGRIGITGFWHRYCSPESGASLSPSHAQVNCMRRLRPEMKKLFRDLLVMGMLVTFPLGVFAQGKGGDKRPPKDPGKVVTPKKEPPPQPPPPQNTNRPKGNDKRRP